MGAVAERGGFATGEFQSVMYDNSVGGISGTVDGGDFGCFAISDGKIINWACVCGRRQITSTRTKSVSGMTDAWLKVTHPTSKSDFVLDVVSGGGTSDNKTTYIKLYDFDEHGGVKVDYRSQPFLPFFYN